MQIPVPDDVTKRKTRLELDPSRMTLSFKNVPEFKPLEGKFKGVMSPMDSVWMIGEHDRRIQSAPPSFHLRNYKPNSARTTGSLGTRQLVAMVFRQGFCVVVCYVEKCAPPAHGRTLQRDAHVKLECRIQRSTRCCKKKRLQHC